MAIIGMIPSMLEIKDMVKNTIIFLGGRWV